MNRLVGIVMQGWTLYRLLYSERKLMVSCATLTDSLLWLASMYAELHSWGNR